MVMAIGTYINKNYYYIIANAFEMVPKLQLENRLRILAKNSISFCLLIAWAHLACFLLENIFWGISYSAWAWETAIGHLIVFNLIFCSLIFYWDH